MNKCSTCFLFRCVGRNDPTSKTCRGSTGDKCQLNIDGYILLLEKAGLKNKNAQFNQISMVFGLDDNEWRRYLLTCTYKQVPKYSYLFK